MTVVSKAHPELFRTTEDPGGILPLAVNVGTHSEDYFKMKTFEIQ